MSEKRELILTALFLLIAIPIVPNISLAQHTSSPVSAFIETFQSLKDWQHLNLPGVRSPAIFEIAVPTDIEGVLLALPPQLHFLSNSSASALIYSSRLTFTDSSVLRWKWLVNKAPQTTDPTTKQGDDYAIRIYIIASNKNSALSTWDKMRLAFADKFGEEKPGPTLGYVWTATTAKHRCNPSPYTSLVRLIAIQGEPGSWSTEAVYPERDFRECFGAPLSDTARIALMTDSDNSGTSSEGYVSSLTLETGEK